MPRLDGAALHAELALTNPALADRIVFVTGGAMTTAGQAFVDEMGARVIFKPFESRVLRAAVAARCAAPSNAAVAPPPGRTR